MKNNKKYDRTFKLSLVALAIGLANQTLAAEHCGISMGRKYSGIDSLYISNKTQATTLQDCTINADTNEFKGAHLLIIEGQQDYKIDNSHLNLNILKKPYSANLIESSDSTITINNSTFTLKSVPFESRYFGRYLLELNKNTKVTIKNSTFTLENESPEENENSTFISAEGAKVDISDTIFKSNTPIAAFIVGQGELTLKNIVLDIPEKSTLIRFGKNKNRVDIIDSTFKAEKMLSSIRFLNDNTSYKTELEINLTNSNVQTKILGSLNNINGTTINLNNSKLSGDITDTYLAGQTIQINLSNNSEYIGKTSLPKYMVEHTGINIKDASSSWRLNDSSAINYLNLNNGHVYISNNKNGEFNTLRIENNLTGNGGIFHLRTDLANEKSDLIEVRHGEGSFLLDIQDSGNIPTQPNGRIKVVHSFFDNKDLKFSLLNKEYVEAGAYKYFLIRDYSNWFLANSTKVDEPEEPKNSFTPEDSSNTNTQPEDLPTTPDAQPEPPSVNPNPQLSNKANAQVSLRQAQLLLVEDELNGIHKRLGEVKNGEKGNVWVRNVNSREKLTALSTGDSQTSGFKQHVHSLQVGADAAVNDHFRLGGFVGRSQANVDFNGNYGEGKVRSHSVGLYATYLADNGIYVDNIAKYSRLKADSDHTEKRRYHAYTLSSELGKQFKLNGNWIITPQAQLGWTHIQGKENEDSLSSVYSRVGLRVAKSFTLASGWNLQPYAEVNGITSRNNNSKIHYANAALNVEDSRGRIESVLGLNAGVANHRFGLEVSRADGKRYDKPYRIQAVYRYHW
ncbi:autotransporter outer membrane beta-barrel domain-containing protein [Rodentibacter heidelbergensis]|uniref:autotransporter outer membrane beta-barrel domain-containing protein n=1 Tax=Rodentibacter heidelbergensis TaxID=1908258 RepID=UPI001FC93027|nr:autotransporter outer membrane beta-barrel domain-containing protein [Rodentibacter heidelbergensis]